MNPTSIHRGSQEKGLTLRDSLAVLRRRRWIVITCVILVPLSATVFSLMQKPQYRGQAEVLLSNQNLANSLIGLGNSQVIQNNGDRVTATQAKLALTPTVAQRTLTALNLNDRSATSLIDATEVKSQPESDILIFRVTDPNQALAARLVNEYARQYSRYRAEIDTAAARNALDEVTTRINGLNGGRDKALGRTLADKQQQLRTLEALQTANAFVVRKEDLAEKVKPTPVRNALLGLVLGLILGIGIAFLRDALDTRIRSAEKLSEMIKMPLLARIPGPGGESEKPVMLTDPRGAASETFRILRGNLDFATLGRDIRTVMITSAVEAEGKTTTITNLAIAMARGGQRVVLVDLDLRRPRIEDMFGLKGMPGVTNVAIRALPLEEACVSIPLDGEVMGTLDVLPCGVIPPDPGEFVGTEVLAEILAQLRENYDTVLIDCSPILRVGDPLTLASRVDGLLVVSRLGTATDAMTSELSRMVGTLPTAKLGLIVTGSSGGEHGYGYGYGYYGYGYGYVQDEPKTPASAQV